MLYLRYPDAVSGQPEKGRAVVAKEKGAAGPKKKVASRKQPRAGATATDAGRPLAKWVPNPKKPGTASHARYAAYEGAATVGAFLAAGGTRADLRWDAEHGYVELG